MKFSKIMSIVAIAGLFACVSVEKSFAVEEAATNCTGCTADMGDNGSTNCKCDGTSSCSCSQQTGGGEQCTCKRGNITITCTKTSANGTCTCTTTTARSCDVVEN